MSCEICGVTVPKPTEELHSQWHTEMVFQIDKLARRLEEPGVIIPEARMPLPDALEPVPLSAVTINTITSAEAEAYWRDKLAAELVERAAIPGQSKRNPKYQQAIREAARTIAKGS